MAESFPFGQDLFPGEFVPGADNDMDLEALEVMEGDS